VRDIIKNNYKKGAFYLFLVLLLSIPIAYASDLMSFAANVKNSAGANINSGNIVIEI